jgi:ABC-2 type transport system permease protein
MLKRILAIIQKEFIQAMRDGVTLAIMLSIPLVQLILFGYAISTTVRHIPTVVVDQSLDDASRDYISDMVNSGYFDVVITKFSEAEAIAEIDAGRANAAFVIPPNFTEEVSRGDAQVLVLVDGSDLFTSQSAYNAANIIGQAHAYKIITEQIQKTGIKTGMLPELAAHIRVLYNPDIKDLWFIIPGMAALLLQTQTVTLTASAVVREREMGTIEQIMVTPIRPIELMIGKIVPYLCIAMLNMLSVVGIGVFWFGVPFQGNFWLFLALAFIYVFSGLGLGLLISTVSQNQRQANQLIMMVMMIAMVLGGFIFPRYTMPRIVQWIGNLFPLTYFVPISRALISKGVGFSAISSQVIALVIFTVVVVVLASISFRRRLE